MNRAWVKQNIDHLSARGCPVNSTPEFAPSKEFYDKLFQAVDLTFAVRQLCNHIGLAIVPQVEVVGDSENPCLDLQSGLRFFDKQIDSAGVYISSKPFGVAKIRIGASQLRSVHRLGHILAHEVTHHYFHLKLIHPIEASETEMFTDLGAVCLGFGKLVVNGITDEPPEVVQRPVYLSDRGIPYLGYPLLAYVYHLCQKRRGATERALYQDLMEPSATMVRTFASRASKKRIWERTLELLGRLPDFPDTDGTMVVREAWRLDPERHRVIACIGCGANLRVPKTDATLKVTCPKCKKQFSLGLRHR